MTASRRKPAWKRWLRSSWRFVWEGDSALALVVDIILAFLLIKFLIYPGIGLAMGTSYPVVAVVSGSMDHHPIPDGAAYQLCGHVSITPQDIPDRQTWWSYCGSWYVDHGINETRFFSFPLSGGFSKGDLVVLVGADPSKLKVGDVIVFQTPYAVEPYGNEPIIHRIIRIDHVNGTLLFQTKGDNNPVSFGPVSGNNFPQPIDGNIPPSHVLGRAILRIPYLGWVKIAFAQLLSGLHLGGVLG